MKTTIEQRLGGRTAIRLIAELCDGDRCESLTHILLNVGYGNPMSKNPSRYRIVLTMLAVLFTGCYPTRPMYLNDRGDLSHYIERATEIEYPDVDVASLEEVAQAARPITVIDPDFDSYMDLTLEQCVGISLQNSKVLRGYGTPNLQGTRVAPGIDNLANGPAAAGTFYNVAVRESEPGFIGTPGQISNPGSILTNTGLEVNQGVEAALADFDTQFTASAFWTTNDEPRNANPSSGVDFLNPEVFQQDTVNWQAEFAKKTANGTQLFFRNTNQWIENNNPLTTEVPPGLQVLDSFYRTALEVELRQPLMRGRGAFIQRMPIVISRIGTDQEIANLEAQLQNMVTNVEIRYWDLHCAYRNLEAAKEGRNAALETWRIVFDQYDKGADVNIQQVAQASEQYHFFDAQVIDSYNTLLTAESDLRWLLGLATTDGRIIRPIDEATIAPVEFDWCSTLDEALTFRPELRQQRWEVKKRQLAVAYSKNSLLPEVNVTALYRWLGLGNKFGTGDSDPIGFPDVTSGAINDLYRGDFQEFSLGLDYRIPIGLRRELSNVRNAQLKLARDIARIEDMELDVTREISEAVRALDANRRIMQSAFNRWKDTEIEKEHFDEIVELGLETLDVALDAQRRKTQAAAAFYSALCEYNKVIALIHRRKGTILAYNGIGFAEGAWPGKAYLDASEHARRRGASRQINYGWTRPQVISQGPIYPPNTQTFEATHDGAIPTDSYVEPAVETEYYEVESPEIINGASPTPQQPRTDGSTTRNDIPINSSRRLGRRSNDDSKPVIPSFIQQASYEQAVIPKLSPTANQSTAKVLAAPRRDLHTSNAQRLPKVNRRVSTRPSNHNIQASKPTSTNEAPKVKVSRPMNWEKFGLTRPGSDFSKSQAAIKGKN